MYITNWGKTRNQTGNPKLGSAVQTSNHTIPKNKKKTEARSQGSRSRGHGCNESSRRSVRLGVKKTKHGDNTETETRSLW